ncbi:DUF861 domain-containing protein [Microbacterium aurantiacum]|uniref:DUF861 domain-containing protein n=2 Tax=Microbacterium aurantiacum TaxID=162393 RepID=A0ABT8FWY6_9MICO|nr:DUF861 domain-containing protein [Microbacterium aurantiacum]
MKMFHIKQIPTPGRVRELMAPSGYVVPEALREGNPQERELAHLTSTDERFSVGVWSAEPYSEFVDRHEGYEYTYVMEGRVSLTDDNGTHTFAAGDAFTLEPGWRGEYRVIERLLKQFVYYSPEESQA